MKSLSNLINLLNIILPLLYLVTTFVYAKFFYREAKWAEKWMGPLLWSTAAIHFAEVVIRGALYQRHPISSIFEATSVLALSIVAIYIYLEWRLKVKTTGYFILIFVFFLQLFSSSFLNSQGAVPEEFAGPIFIFHTSAAILGVASLVISAIYGFLYLLLFYDIKSKHFGVLFGRLPSLETLQKMNLKTAKVGFFFFSVAIALGLAWSHMLDGPDGPMDPKALVSWLIWVIYGIEILGAKIWGWSGKKLAYLSLSGLVILLFSLVIVNRFLTSFHSYM